MCISYFVNTQCDRRCKTYGVHLVAKRISSQYLSLVQIRKVLQPSYIIKFLKSILFVLHCMAAHCCPMSISVGDAS